MVRSMRRSSGGPVHVLCGQDKPGYVKIPLTQAELAQLVQTTPETISRTLHRLREEKIVRVNPKGELSVAEAALRDYLNEGF